MTIWAVIWVVLMMFWLFYGSWLVWDPARPQAVGGTLIPWLCVLILGLVVFGAIEDKKPTFQRSEILDAKQVQVGGLE